MSLINNTGEEPKITAETKPGVTIVIEGDTLTVATHNLGNGRPVQGTYRAQTSLKDIEEDLKRKAEEE